MSLKCVETGAEVDSAARLSARLPDGVYKDYVCLKARSRKFEEYQRLFEPSTNNLMYKEIRRSIKPVLGSYMYARNSYYKFYQDHCDFYPNPPFKQIDWNVLLTREHKCRDADWNDQHSTERTTYAQTMPHSKSKSPNDDLATN